MTQYISLDDILRENGIPLSLHRYDRLMASFTKRAKEVGEDAYKLPRADADSWFEHEAKPIILRHDEAMHKRAKPASERDLEHASRIAATEATVKLTSEALRLTAEAVKATSDALASVNKNTQSLLHIVACHEATLSELLGRCEVLKELR
jgi:hypothetical protein